MLLIMYYELAVGSRAFMGARWAGRLYGRVLPSRTRPAAGAPSEESPVPHSAFPVANSTLPLIASVLAGSPIAVNANVC